MFKFAISALLAASSAVAISVKGGPPNGGKPPKNAGGNPNNAGPGQQGPGIRNRVSMVHSYLDLNDDSEVTVFELAVVNNLAEQAGYITYEEAMIAAHYFLQLFVLFGNEITVGELHGYMDSLAGPESIADKIMFELAVTAVEEVLKTHNALVYFMQLDTNLDGLISWDEADAAGS